jgi:transaldolase
MNSFKKINNFSEIVTDTGDIDIIKLIKPMDVTTNPSLILKVSKDVRFKNLINSNDLEKILVNFGTEISKYIDGYISTEVNPNFSFDTKKTIEIAKKIIKIYQENNVDKERILIKIAATWEGILAAKELEKEGIKCNLTLIFSKVQAIACAQANVTLISPFVGRITDWYKKNGYVINDVKDDYGVNNVKEINNYIKKNNYSTIVMGASFRNIDQIKALAGLDKLTISPNLINELKNDINLEFDELKLDEKCDYSVEEITEDIFRNEMKNNKMASEKLKEGIDKFIIDTNELIGHI